MICFQFEIHFIWVTEIGLLLLHNISGNLCAIIPVSSFRLYQRIYCCKFNLNAILVLGFHPFFKLIEFKWIINNFFPPVSGFNFLEIISFDREWTTISHLLLFWNSGNEEDTWRERTLFSTSKWHNVFENGMSSEPNSCTGK